jgi:S-formylglutathione hydrolase FrmB
VATVETADEEVQEVRSWNWLIGLSLVHGPVHAVLIGGALVALLGLLLLRRTRSWWRRRVPLAVLGAAALVGAGLVLVAATRPWPDRLSWQVPAWIGAGLLGLLLLVLGWRHQRWWVRALALGAALLLVVGVADGVDAVYGAFPTVATALQLPPYDQIDVRSVLTGPGSPTTAPAGPVWQTWRAPPDLPAHGGVSRVNIPATRSGFQARPAWLYLPPAYLTAHPPSLPVLVMLGGQPGGPRDWLDGGQLAERVDAFAAAHGGLAPIVVMPDALGSQLANPLCMDSALGKVDTYLSQDVVRWVITHLQVGPTARWAVGGLSSGGTCAWQLAVAHPELFPTFFDASGQRGPTLGSRARTVAATFHGDGAAFAAVDPMSELTKRSYPSSAGYLVVGAQDKDYVPQQQAVAAASRAAGMTIVTAEMRGHHQWQVWGKAFGDALPWLAGRMGLTS